MKVDIDKLTQVLHEIFGDVDGNACTSAVCIADATGIDGRAMQIQLLATNDIDEIITSESKYKCVEL